ncbi:hypothetical protein NLI96_g8016 [Meripilus lineatus]|uniref:Amino acid transporter n=1 Tax=Meripilus lineatus TaxID=2056292 RepID=A0AAD5YGP0_9APHY|nr:hypothetical protein NLI96_g8016 [Physisporinus lineatus]
MSVSKNNKESTIARRDEELLASLGYKQEFRRAFTALETFGIAFSIIGLLPSIASVLVYSIPNGGPVAMVWGWLVASCFILFVGMSMAELASSAPTSGGLYFWTFALSSPRWRTLLSWICGYSNTIGSIASIASIDWGCAVQVMAAASIGSDLDFEATSAQTLLCLAVIVALPAATPPEFRNNASYALGNFTNTNGWTNGFAFTLSFLSPLWTISSFDSSVHISEEASNAATAVPWAIVGAIAISGILGWAINMSLAFCMGTDLDGIINSPSGQPMSTIFFNSFGKTGTLVVWVLAASRQTFAFSRDGALPFSGWLYRMNKYTKTPVNTVWFTCIWSIILGLLTFAGDSATNAIFSLGVTSLYVAYALPICARFFGTNNFKPGPFNLGPFSIPVAFIAVLWMIFTSIILMFPSTPQTDVVDMNYAVVVQWGTLILSLVYFYFPKYGGVYWFKGPVPTLDVANETLGHHDDSAFDGDFKLAEKCGVEVLDSQPTKP